MQMLERVRMHIHRGVTLPFPKLENHFCATLPVIEWLFTHCNHKTFIDQVLSATRCAQPRTSRLPMTRTMVIGAQNTT